MRKEKTHRKPHSLFLFYKTVFLTLFVIAVLEHILDAQITSVLNFVPTARKERTVDSGISVSRTASGVNQNKVKNRTIHIVAHAPNHGMLRRDPMRVFFSRCKVNNCHVTVSKYTDGADAIIIEGGSPRKPLPVRKSSSQIIIFASVETPLYLNFVNLENPFWNLYYNWSMTFRTDSDIPYMYGYVYPKYLSKQTVFNHLQTDSILKQRRYLEYEEEVYQNPTGSVRKQYRHIYGKKHVTAAWLVSHCQTSSRREGYIKIMNKTINIDIYGNCNNRTCPTSTISACQDKIVENTFFYLAFENSYCVDYITEKSFNWFVKDIVIVVRGARKYGNHLPKGTYIDADNFKNPTKLADFLKRLSANEKEYIRYLKRKDMYKVFQRETMAEVAFCNLCRKLNNLDMYGKTFDMKKSWTNDSCIDGKYLRI